MSYQNLKVRFKFFGINVIRFVKKLPKNSEFRIIERQIIRSSTSTGANYRAACRAKSPADFINKLKIVEEETDETLYWLEVTAELLPSVKIQIVPLYKEGNELLAITVKSIQTARARRKK